MKQRNEKMNELVKKLSHESKEYFRGKELNFENNSRFVQCVRHAASNAFVSVQNVKIDGQPNFKVNLLSKSQIFSSEDTDCTEIYLKIPNNEKAENKMFNNPGDSIIEKYTTLEDHSTSHDENLNSIPLTLISIWD